jgi:cystathionine beta-lyase
VPSTQPLKTFSLEELQKRHSTKWRDFAPDILPLPVMEMDFEIAEPIRRQLSELIQTSDTGYLGSIPEMAINLASFAKARWNWELDTEGVFAATDVGVGVVEMARMMREAW